MAICKFTAVKNVEPTREMNALHGQLMGGKSFNFTSQRNIHKPLGLKEGMFWKYYVNTMADDVQGPVSI